MSLYENQAWSASGRQPTWDQAPPPRTSTASTINEDSTAFSGQFEEVDRAIDNLVKSGKLFGGLAARRESLPLMGAPRQFNDFDPRMGGGMPQRHHSVSDFDPTRAHPPGNAQNFYASQRFQPRAPEPEPMMQAKRRMAAQRERELRNYHQEQQYNRNVATHGRPERNMSPGSLNEEERRDLIARQRSALFNNEPAPFGEAGAFGAESQMSRPTGPAGPQTSSAGGRGHSPLTFDPFGSNQPQLPKDGQAGNVEQNPKASGSGPSPVQHQQRSRANSTSSPASNQNTFSLFDNAAQHSSRTSNSSPGGSSPPNGNKASGPSGTSGVAPIGTRPAVSQAINPALNKRSTTPLPSPLSYGYSNDDAKAGERSNSAASTSNNNNNNTAQEPAASSSVGLGWGNKNAGVWGTKSSLGMQASVWG